MCEPVTLGTIAATTAIASGTVGAIGAVRQGNYEAELAKNNAQLLEFRRQDALTRGAQEAGRIRAEGSRLVGAQEAAIAASGVDPTVGSPAGILAGTEVATAIDAEIVKSNAVREAWGFDIQKQDVLQRGRLAKRAGLMTAVGTGLGAVGGAIGGFGTIAGPSLFPKTK
jgi:hypothetical protein